MFAAVVNERAAGTNVWPLPTSYLSGFTCQDE
jgi:hypothetical protein